MAMGFSNRLSGRGLDPCLAQLRQCSEFRTPLLGTIIERARERVGHFSPKLLH